MKVKPVAGRIVPDPGHGDVLPADGREVPDDQYWHRRLEDGDVVVINEPAPKAHAKTAGD